MSDQVSARRNDSLNASASRRVISLSKLDTSANAHTDYLTKLLKSGRRECLPPGTGRALYTWNIADQAIPTARPSRRGKEDDFFHNLLNFLHFIFHPINRSGACAPPSPSGGRFPGGADRLARPDGRGRPSERGWPTRGQDQSAPGSVGARISRRWRRTYDRSARASRAAGLLSLENRPCTPRPAARLVAASP